jgi:hypothetical protein
MAGWLKPAAFLPAIFYPHCEKSGLPAVPVIEDHHIFLPFGKGAAQKDTAF